MNPPLELAERCEKATGSDRELDINIAGTMGMLLGFIPLDEPLRYTASLDAAMTLVPEGWFLHVSRFSEGEMPLRGNAHIYADRWLGDDYEADAATPALALCAAALRSHAAIAIADTHAQRGDAKQAPGTVNA